MELLVALLGGISMYVSLSILNENNLYYVITGQLFVVSILFYAHIKSLKIGNKIK